MFIIKEIDLSPMKKTSDILAVCKTKDDANRLLRVIFEEYSQPHTWPGNYEAKGCFTINVKDDECARKFELPIGSVIDVSVEEIPVYDGKESYADYCQRYYY